MRLATEHQIYLGSFFKKNHAMHALHKVEERILLHGLKQQALTQSNQTLLSIQHRPGYQSHATPILKQEF
jgi:hypothetical protein